MEIVQVYFSLLLMIIHAVSSQLKVNIDNASFNQPKLCPTKSWNPNGTTFANITTLGTNPNTIFIDKSNRIYVTANARNQTLMWSETNNRLSMSIIGTGLSSPHGLFVSASGDVYIDNAMSNGRIDRWFSNGTNDSPIVNLTNSCFNLFIDENETLYCSTMFDHTVYKIFLNSTPTASLLIAAGNRSAGSTAELLNEPHGIFVDSALALYVADANNNRIQRFSSLTSIGLTLLDNIHLNYPTSLTMDADEYLYVCDSGNHRILGQGPSGFRCILGCTGSNGSAMNQFNVPYSFSFDTHGNIYVNDRGNHRIQKFLLMTNSCVSCNRPRLCSAAWKPSAITFTDSSVIGVVPWGISVDTYDSIYILARSIDQILVWERDNLTVSKTIATPAGSQTTISTDTNGDIYFDSGINAPTSVYKLSEWGNISIPMISIPGRCYGLFVDLYNRIYCSLGDYHQVIRGLTNITTIVAGNGTPGRAPDLLSSPRGIFVTVDLRLYVADCDNNRIQLFKNGQTNGTTAFENNTFPLNCPNDIILDYDGNFFITDSLNHRIITSGPNGPRCIAGCSQANGSAANQLSYPTILRFDSFGNLFVSDNGNHRIQKFLIENNFCYASQHFVPSTCGHNNVIGPHCNITALACDVLKPCLNGGICVDVNNVTDKYICLCQLGFIGRLCEINLQPCQSDTCRNGGSCFPTSNTTFNCQCLPQWQGNRCEQRRNYCVNVTCLNDGVCRSLSTTYQCECLGNSYSGVHCEIVSPSTKLNEIIARGFAFVAIIVMATTVLFIAFMDILKYWFGIDVIEKKSKAKRPRKKVTVIHFFYIN